MTKIAKLHEWLTAQNDWVYLSQVPNASFEMSKAACSTALITLCNQGKAEFRVVGLKQYRGLVVTSKTE